MATTTATAFPRKRINLKIWILEARPQYLLLPVVLVMLGTAIAWSEGYSNPGYAVLALVGLLLCHISVNILNDYFDFKSGIDQKTIKTPFSGGSGILPAGMLTSQQVLWYGIICLILAIPVGVFFVIVQGIQLLPLLILGVFCIIFYSPFILKHGFPEWSPGVGLGSLPVIGAYYVQTGHYSLNAVIASIPSGFLVLNLLLLNEFVDADADRTGARRTLPISLGARKAAIIYTTFTILTYIWIIVAVILNVMAFSCLLSLMTFPFAVKAIRGSFHSNDKSKILPAMASNVLMVLLTQFLLGIGFILIAI